jgi:superfamily II DNA/RNA helicase
MVATDIAARGIHVDDVSLVVHADPPVEHKAYLHRSGRTARAGAEGTVVTLMMDAQVGDVRDLTRRAGIKPMISRTQPGDDLIARIAPGERTYVAAADLPAAASGETGNGSRGGSGRGNAGRSNAGGRGSGRGGSRSQALGGQSSSSTGGRSTTSGRKGGGQSSSAGGSARSGRRGGSGSGGSTTVYSSTSSHSAAGFSGSRRSR